MPSSLVFLWWCPRRNTLPSLVLKSSDHIKNNFQSTYHVEMNPNDQECFSLLEDSSETVKPQTTSYLHTQLSLCPPTTGALFYHLQFEGLQLLFHTAQRVINDFICSKLPYELTGILRANCCHVSTPCFHYLPRGGREEEETVKKCSF